MWPCSITRTDLGPYRQKVLYIPAVYLVTTLVSHAAKILHATFQPQPILHVTVDLLEIFPCILTGE